MPTSKESKTQFTFHPLTPSRWGDFETLFGDNGACGGCWCMTWRLTAKEFQLRKGTGNRRAMKKVVTAGPPPGILAYSGGKAVGWCSIAPRSEFVRLVKSRVLAPVDDQDVWSVTCFFVRRDFRKQGLALALLKAAAAFAKRKGAKLIEGYPQELTKELPAPFVWTGLASSFRKAGFEVAERRSPTRPIMRKKT